MFVLGFLFRTLTSHHLLDVGYEWDWLIVSIGMSAGTPLLMSLYYLALEPYIRRTWPELLVSWSRLLSGRFTDPLVGRDILVGTLLGVLHAMLWVGLAASPFFLPVRGLTPNFLPTVLESTPAFLGNGLQTFVDGVINSMGAMSLLFLLGRLTRRKLIVVIIIGFFWGILTVTGYNYPLEILAALVSGALMAYTLGRFGLLATIFLFYVNTGLQAMPFTFDFDRWYAARGLFALLIVLTLTIYGVRVSLGSRPLLAPEAD